MTKYLLKRILHGLVSIVIVVALVMIMIYTMLDRNLVFAGDTKYSHTSNNARVAYKYSKWEDYGYLDYVTYSDWLNELVSSGELTEEERSAVVGFGRTKAQDSEQVSEYVKKFTKYYKSQGYTVVRKDAVMMNKKKYADGGQQQLFAAVFARSGHQVCRDAADDVGRERQHKMAGDEEEQAHHKAHDRDAAEFLQLGGQQHIDAAGDQRGHGGQQNVAHARQQCTGEGRHSDKHKVQRGKDADRDQIGHGQLVGLLVHGDSS